MEILGKIKYTHTICSSNSNLGELILMETHKGMCVHCSNVVVKGIMGKILYINHMEYHAAIETMFYMYA